MFISLNAILSSFVLVAFSEMGDKTQLLAFSLAVRFKKPGWILLGIFVATLGNHFLAALFGSWVSGHVPARWLAGGLAFIFIFFGLWTLKPDEAEEVAESTGIHAFFATTFLFFLAEIGDKTQLATVALAARFHSVWSVVVGSTLGMLLSDGLAVYMGERLAEKVSMQRVRQIAAAIFLVFGLISAWRAFEI